MYFIFKSNVEIMIFRGYAKISWIFLLGVFLLLQFIYKLLKFFPIICQATVAPKMLGVLRAD